jgi:hypothetical protein
MDLYSSNMWRCVKHILLAPSLWAALVERGFSRFMMAALLVRNKKQIQGQEERQT